MPVVDDILHHRPDARVDWVVEEAYADLVRLNRGVHRVIPFALRRWRKSLFSASTRAQVSSFLTQLRDEAYDFVLDTQGLLKTGIVMRAARLAPGGKRVGLANATEGSGYESSSRIFHHLSIPVPLRTPAVLRARLVAAGALGYVPEGAPRFGMQPPAADDVSWLPAAPYAVFFHGTARAAKRWDENNWIVLGRGLAGAGLPILLPWGDEAERQTAERLAAAIPAARVTPRLSIMQALVLAQRAALVVGTDSGLTHVAAAYERPTVELYCDSPRWKTEADWSPRIINLGDLGTPPSVAQVEQAAGKLLADFPASRAGSA